MWVDARSGTVNPRFVTLRRGLIREQARAQAVLYWDTCERKRVAEWNLHMAVYWGRNRLLRNLRDYQHTSTPANPAAANRPTTEEIPYDERLEELVQVRSSLSILDTFARVSVEAHDICGDRSWLASFYMYVTSKAF